MNKPDNPKTSRSDFVPFKRIWYNPNSNEYEELSPNRRANTGKFIRGPIPLNWVILANKLPGKAGQVGVALWFLSGLANSKTFRLTGEIEVIAGCARQTLYSALDLLESHDLIKQDKGAGRRPLITILTLDNDDAEKH